MAYSLISTFGEEPSWAELHARLEQVRGGVELFPIHDSGGSALGIAIPRKVANGCVGNLEAILEVVRQFGGATVDLFSGRLADAKEWPAILARLGEDSAS